MLAQRHFCKTILLPVFLILFNACERNNYELLNPATAGVWTYYDTSSGLLSNQVRDIQLDSKGNLWFSFPGYGTAKFDNLTWTYYRTGITPLLNDGVICTAESTDGKIMIGTSNGISILDNNNVWSSYKDHVTSMYVNSIKVASNGWIWVGTQSQGYYVNKGSGFVKNLSERYKNVNVIEEGVNGNIYLGTDSGLIRFDGSVYTYISKDNGLPDNKVSSLYLDKKERLWVGTDGGKTVSWIDKQGLHQLNLMTGSDSVHVKDIWEDRSGDVWFATFKNGLIRYDGVIPYSFRESNGFRENRIYSIGEDKDGNLWFGLYSKGVAKYTLPIDKQ
jgi:ligand-binding sensor domain-containing protein